MNYKQGDLIQAYKDEDVKWLIHQIHSQGKGYAGFAGKLQKEYPDCFPLGPSTPGEWHVYSGIFSICAQIYPGHCTFGDTYEGRLKRLKHAISEIIFVYQIEDTEKIGIPLIGSGLGSDLGLKKDMTDLEYFKQYIAPALDELGLNFIAYYL
jgi:predicted RNase H-like HicB family nuclease